MTDAKSMFDMLSGLMTGDLDDAAVSSALYDRCDPGLLQSIHVDQKRKADAAYKRKAYREAIDAYTACIVLTTQDKLIDRAKLFANRSLCFLNNGQADAAYSDACKAIALQPKWAKVFRKYTNTKCGSVSKMTTPSY